MSIDRVTILVVEDEPLLRMDIVEELEDAGFEVFAAANSTIAIELLIANKSISVMFTDIDMPGGINGFKLAAVVRDRWPLIAIIVTSGLHTIDLGKLPVEGRFMAKPYNSASVIRSIHEMIVLA
jgi:CheY-like chemotaxis protein